MSQSEFSNCHRTKEKYSISGDSELPIGFGLLLAANEKAMKVFSNMPDAEKKKVVETSRQMHSREAMEQYVAELGEA